VPTNYSRRASVPATIGAGALWTFPRGFIVLKTKSLALYVVATGAVLDTWVVVDE
jgi:hypothetical protein